MTTANDTLAPCPFCGAPASGYAIEAHAHAMVFAGQKMPDHTGSYVIEGDCACGSGMIGDTQAEVTERWNRRTPAPAIQPVAVPANGWLRDGSMVYRLTDQRIPSNRDEISVTMVDGSRDLDQRKEQAERIRQMLQDQPPATSHQRPAGRRASRCTRWRRCGS